MSPQERDEYLERIESQCRDHNRRVASLESEHERIDARVLEHDRRVLTLETTAKVTDNELISLRASRHEHSNWLNRHNLEVSALQLQMIEKATQFSALITKAETMTKDFTALQLTITTQLATIKSDLRQTMWIVSVVVGVLVFVGRAIANRYGF